MINTQRIIVSTLIVFTLFLSFSTFAYSQDACCCEDLCCNDNACCCQDDCGFYIGAQVGYVDSHWDNIDQNAFSDTIIIVKKDYGVGVRPYIGYAFNKYFSAEFGWTYLNYAKFDKWNGFGFENVPLTKIFNNAYDASIRLSVPLFCQAGLFTRVGLSYLLSHHSTRWLADSFQDVNTQPTTKPFRLNSACWSVTFAFGAYYDITCNVRAELSWTRFGGNTLMTDNYQPSPDFFSFGLSYRL